MGWVHSDKQGQLDLAMLFLTGFYDACGNYYDDMRAVAGRHYADPSPHLNQNLHFCLARWTDPDNASHCQDSLGLLCSFPLFLCSMSQASIGFFFYLS